MAGTDNESAHHQTCSTELASHGSLLFVTYLTYPDIQMYYSAIEGSSRSAPKIVRASDSACSGVSSWTTSSGCSARQRSAMSGLAKALINEHEHSALITGSCPHSFARTTAVVGRQVWSPLTGSTVMVMRVASMGSWVRMVAGRPTMKGRPRASITHMAKTGGAPSDCT